MADENKKELSKITLSNGSIVELREGNTGDLFDAVDDTKVVHETSKGPMFIIDNFKLERQLLLSSIKSIDDGKIEITIEWLRSLASHDFDYLSKSVEKLDQAVLSEVGSRGRDSAASGQS